MEDYKFGVYSVNAVPPDRYTLIDETVIHRCYDATSLCAAIYPFIRELMHEYFNKLDSPRERDSFRQEIEQLISSLEKIVGIPAVTLLPPCAADYAQIRLNAIRAAVEMAVCIAESDVQQARVSIRRIMETFVSAVLKT